MLCNRWVCYDNKSPVLRGRSCNEDWKCYFILHLIFNTFHWNTWLVCFLLHSFVCILLYCTISEILVNSILGKCNLEIPAKLMDHGDIFWVSNTYFVLKWSVAGYIQQSFPHMNTFTYKWKKTMTIKVLN